MSDDRIRVTRQDDGRLRIDISPVWAVVSDREAIDLYTALGAHVEATRTGGERDGMRIAAQILDAWACNPTHGHTIAALADRIREKAGDPPRHPKLFYGCDDDHAPRRLDVAHACEILLSTAAPHTAECKTHAVMFHVANALCERDNARSWTSLSECPVAQAFRAGKGWELR